MAAADSCEFGMSAGVFPDGLSGIRLNEASPEP